MKKFFPRLLKKYVYPSVLCVSVGTDISGTMVHKNNLSYKVRESAESYLSSQGIETYDIPARLKTDYEYKLEDAETILYNRATSQGRRYVDDSEINRIVHEKMKPFIKNMRSVVHDYELASKMRGFIRRFLWNKGVNPNRIPKRFEYTYESRKNRVLNRLNSLMLQDGRDYVRINELEKAIQNEFAFFVSQVLDELDSHRPYTNQSSGLDDYLFGDITIDDIYSDDAIIDTYYDKPMVIEETVTTYDVYDDFDSDSSDDIVVVYEPEPEPEVVTEQVYEPVDPNQVTIYQLEGHVQTTARSILRNNNINPDNLPARIISYYSDAIQTITLRLRNTMSVYERDYVWKDEVETVAFEELQPIIDKIMYKGEICVVCQDDYDSGERVGTLDCGHFYHDDCIRPWLNQSGSCPLCRASGVYVAKIETVP